MADESAALPVLLTVKQVAAQLNLSVSGVYLLVEQGRIAHHRIGTGRGSIRISEEDLNQFLEAVRQSASDSDNPPRQARPRLKHIRL